MAEKLFSDYINPSDKLYCIIRDEQRCDNYKSYIENLWSTYQPYADKDFPMQLAQDFHARFWEMYLTCTLIHKSFDVVPKQTRAKGPDIKINHASTAIWIEAVTPTSGSPTKPDSVPDLKYGVAQQVPDDQITLRYCSAIHDKYSDKYFKYVKDGIITLEDCYIVALNGCKIPWRGGDFEPPRIVRCVLPFGWQVVTTNTSSHKVVNRGNQYRAYLKKTSGNTVDTDIFIKSEYSHISAIIFSNIDFANLTPAMGEDFIIIHNPLTSTKLPDNFPKVGREYKAELSEDTIKLFSKDLK